MKGRVVALAALTSLSVLVFAAGWGIRALFDNVLQWALARAYRAADADLIANIRFGDACSGAAKGSTLCTVYGGLEVASWVALVVAVLGCAALLAVWLRTSRTKVPESQS